MYADGINYYDTLASDHECIIRHLKTHKAYNNVEHLNTVSYIHSLIKDKLSHYRGVATKYMNRYMSLLAVISRFQGNRQQWKNADHFDKTEIASLHS